MEWDLVDSGTTTFDPTFGSFTLLELVSHWVSPFLLWKCLECLKLEQMFLGMESADTIGRHLIYWQGQRVCDALFNIFVVPPSISAKKNFKEPMLFESSTCWCFFMVLHHQTLISLYIYYITNSSSFFLFAHKFNWLESFQKTL
jgi:hypothetical protein